MGKYIYIFFYISIKKSTLPVRRVSEPWLFIILTSRTTR